MPLIYLLQKLLLLLLCDTVFTTRRREEPNNTAFLFLHWRVRLCRVLRATSCTAWRLPSVRTVASKVASAVVKIYVSIFSSYRRYARRYRVRDVNVAGAAAATSASCKEAISCPDERLAKMQPIIVVKNSLHSYCTTSFLGPPSWGIETRALVRLRATHTRGIWTLLAEKAPDLLLLLLLLLWIVTRAVLNGFLLI